MEATNLQVTPGYCPECGQYPQAPEPSRTMQAGLSGINCKELVGIKVWLHARYDHDRSPGVRRQIHAMQKVLEYFGLSNQSSDQNTEGNNENSV